MMSLEGPYLAALIARSALPKFNLAAFGVAFSFALIIEAPIIMIMSASTALVHNRHDYFKLRNYTFLLNLLITVIMIIGMIPGVFYHITEEMIGLPHNVAKLTHIASVILLPWPAAIGFRRFYQGLLIKNNLTKRVAYGTVVRLIFMSITALILFSMKISGAYVGAAALSAGVIAEGIFSRITVDSTINKILGKSEVTGKSKKLTFKSITKFYYPLALTTILALGVHPMVTFFIGKSTFPLESLAVLPVINSLVFIFRSLGLSYQEVVIALMNLNKKNFDKLVDFSRYLGIFVFVSLSLIVFTPVLNFWFKTVSGLTMELTGFSILPTRIMVILPVLTVLISYQRAILVYVRGTDPIKWASLIEIILILAVLYTTIYIYKIPGAVSAALAYITGRFFANLYLFPYQIKAKHKIKNKIYE